MKIDIRSNNVQIGSAFKSRVKDKIRRLFLRSGSKIENVVISLSDVNGPKGGLDKQCKIQLKIDGAGSILTSSRHQSVYQAFAASMRKAGIALSRTQEKARSIKRTPLVTQLAP